MSRRVVGRPAHSVHRLLRSPVRAERLVRGRRTAVRAQLEENAVRFDNVWRETCYC